MKLLPRVVGTKQRTALFTVVLLLGLTHANFDGAPLHVEPSPVEPTTAVVMAATGTSAATMIGRSYYAIFDGHKPPTRRF